MLKKAYLKKEIVLDVVNKVGVLADMSKLLAVHGINLEAVAGYAKDDNKARIMLVVEDTLRAMDALKKANYTGARENEVVVVELENKPGALKVITEKLASEGIDIKQVYGTTCPAGTCPARIVLTTSDNEKALVAFKK